MLSFRKLAMPDNSRGHTMVELVIAIALAAVLIAAIYQVHAVRQRSHTRQQLAVEMQQNIRAAISLMKREIRMAGYDPASKDGRDNDENTVIDNDEESANTGIHIAGRNMIQFTFDNDADMTINSDERVTYGFAHKYDHNKDGIADAGAAPLGRQTGVGTLIPVAENIQAVGFAYAFDNNDDGNLDTDDGTVSGNIIWAFDANLSDEAGQLTTDLETGLPLAVPVSLSNIRAVRIWILARTRAPVRSYLDNRTYAVGDRSISCSDKYRRRLTRATVYCRNTRL
jgi:type IV pilus assembly protein PilW